MLLNLLGNAFDAVHEHGKRVNGEEPEIERLQEELDALKPEITAALWDEPTDNRGEHAVVYLGHRIALVIRLTYAYPPEIEQMADDLRTLKLTTRQEGRAECVRVSSIPVVSRLDNGK